LEGVEEARRAWVEVALALVDALPPHVEVCIPRDLAPHPERAGLQRALGLGRGRHYSLTLPGGGRLHVRVLRGEGCFRAHWDLRDPRVDPLGHLLFDAPGFSAAAAGVANMIVELSRAATPLAALAGLALGGGATLLMAALARLL